MCSVEGCVRPGGGVRVKEEVSDVVFGEGCGEWVVCGCR